MLHVLMVLQWWSFVLRRQKGLMDMGRMVNALRTSGSDALRGARRSVFEKIAKAVWAKSAGADKVSPFGTFVEFDSTEKPFLEVCTPYHKAMKEALGVMRKDAGAENGGFTKEQLDDLPALAMLMHTSASEFETYVSKKPNSAGEDKTLKTLSVELPVRWKYQLQHLAPFYPCLVFRGVRQAARAHLTAIGAVLSSGRDGRTIHEWKYWDDGLESVYEQQAQPLPVTVDMIDVDLETFLETAALRRTFSEEISTIVKTVLSSKVALFDALEDSGEGRSSKKKPVLSQEVYSSLEYFVEVSAPCAATLCAEY